MQQGIKTKTLSNLLWKFAERCGAQGVSFVVSIVLARILDPSLYGTIALVTVFTTILNVFVEGGFGNALIQKKDADDIDFSSVFYFNLTACLILYAGMFIMARPIAHFYKDDSLVPVIRVLSTTVLISGVKNIQNAYVSRTLQFKRFFFATLGGTIGAAVIGITMAVYGMGVWALVAQQLFNATMDTIILWFTVRWRPKKVFSFERIKKLFNVGWKLLVSNLINSLYNNLRQLIIGKMYSAVDLAYYDRGQQMPNLIVANINTAIDSVLLPVMSREQDSKSGLKAITRRAIKVSSFIMWPMMVGMAVVAEPLINALLTEKWMFALPYLRVFCVIYAFQPIQSANLNAIIALGKTGLYMKMEIIKKSVGILILLVSMRFGVLAIALGLLVYSLFAQLVNSAPNRKLLGYSYGEQMLDILPCIGLSGIMALAIYPIQLLQWNDWVILLLQIVLGMIVYIGGSALFKIDTFTYLMDIVKNIMKRGNKNVD